MNASEWTNLSTALTGCANHDGTLYYSFDAKLAQLIEKFSPRNGFPYPSTDDYRAKDSHESELAIQNWIRIQRSIEENVVLTYAQLDIGKSDKHAQQIVVPKMVEEKRILIRGAVVLKYFSMNFPKPEEPKQIQAKALFELAQKAITEFQSKQTALFLFPNVVIPDGRVFSGFYGSPWGMHNSRTLKLYFRNINPNFDIHLFTSEIKKDGSRRAGVLFTYLNPW